MGGFWIAPLTRAIMARDGLISPEAPESNMGAALESLQARMIEAAYLYMLGEYGGPLDYGPDYQAGTFLGWENEAPTPTTTYTTEGATQEASRIGGASWIIALKHAFYAFWTDRAREDYEHDLHYRILDTIPEREEDEALHEYLYLRALEEGPGEWLGDALNNAACAGGVALENTAAGLDWIEAGDEEAADRIITAAHNAAYEALYEGLDWDECDALIIAGMERGRLEYEARGR